MLLDEFIVSIFDVLQSFFILTRSVSIILSSIQLILYSLLFVFLYTLCDKLEIFQHNNGNHNFS